MIPIIHHSGAAHVGVRPPFFHSQIQVGFANGRTPPQNGVRPALHQASRRLSKMAQEDLSAARNGSERQGEAHVFQRDECDVCEGLGVKGRTH